MLAVTAGAPKRLTRLDEQHLMEFGDLLSTAIASIEDRAKLAAQAATDPLTGLANHRTLQQRLSAEVARAIRHDTPLSVAVIDVDHFKQINDSGGHDAGDAMLAPRRALPGEARPGRGHARAASVATSSPGSSRRPRVSRRSSPSSAPGA